MDSMRGAHMASLAWQATQAAEAGKHGKQKGNKNNMMSAIIPEGLKLQPSSSSFTKKNNEQIVNISKESKLSPAMDAAMRGRQRGSKMAKAKAEPSPRLPEN